MYETRSSQPPFSQELHVPFPEAQVEHQQHFTAPTSKLRALEILIEQLN